MTDISVAATADAVDDSYDVVAEQAQVAPSTSPPAPPSAPSTVVPFPTPETKPPVRVNEPVNKYAIEEAQKTEPPIVNKYSIGAIRQNEDTRARASVLSAQGGSPDAAAKALDLSKKTGVPPDAIEADPLPAHERAAINKYSLSSPQIKEWLAKDPYNARVSSDDTDSLSNLDKSIRKMKALTTPSEGADWEATLYPPPVARGGFMFKEADRPGPTDYATAEFQRGIESTTASLANTGMLADIRAQRELSDIMAGKPPVVPRGGGPKSPYLSMTPDERIAEAQMLDARIIRTAAQIKESREYQASLPEDPAIAPFNNALDAINAKRVADTLLATIGRAGLDKAAGDDIGGKQIRDAILAFAKDPWAQIRSATLQNLPQLAGTVAAGAVAGPVGAGIAGFSLDLMSRGEDVIKLAIEDARDVGDTGVDTRDPVAVAEFLQRNPGFITPALARAALGSATIGAVDALTQRLTQPVRRVRDLATVAPLNIGREVATEAGGEALAQQAAQQPTDLKGIVGEALGGVASSAATTAVKSVQEVQQAGAEERQKAAVKEAGETVTAANELLGDLQKRIAETGAVTLDDMVEKAGASKLATRSPDKLEDFIATITGPASSVFVPIDAVNVLLQSMPPEDARALTDALGITDQIPEAFASGGDVVIPLSKYVTESTRSKVHEAWRDDVRLEADGFSKRQVEEDIKVREARLADFIKRAEAQIEAGIAEVDATQRVYEDMLAKLKTGGRYTDDAAKQQAALFAQRYATRAERSGGAFKDAWDAYSKAGMGTGVDVRTQLSERVGAYPPDDLDVLLDSIRTGKVRPTTTDADANARFAADREELVAALQGLGIDPKTRTNAQIRAAIRAEVLKKQGTRTAGRTLEQADLKRIEELTREARHWREVRKQAGTDREAFNRAQERLLPIAQELGDLTGHPLGLDDPETAVRFAGADEKFTPDKAIIAAAVKEFGITRNPRQAGYILPDGRMLNFGEDGVRGTDHRAVSSLPGIEASDTEGMIEFMNRTGAVRVDFNSGLFEAQRIPTVAQMRTATTAARQEGVDILAEASRPDGSSKASLDLDRPSVDRLRAFFDEQAAGKTFFQAARDAISAELSAIADGKTSGRAVSIGGVSSWLVEQARAAGVDISGYRHAVDVSALQHIMNRHGNAKIEASRGQIVITQEDLQRIPDLLASPDFVVFGATGNRRQDVIGYIKTLEDGTVLYLEERRTRRHELAALAMRKYPAATNTETIASTLASTPGNDDENALKIVPAEGQSSVAGDDSLASTTSYEQSHLGHNNPPITDSELEDDLSVNALLNPNYPARKARSRSVEEVAIELNKRGQDALRALGIKSGRIDGPGEKTDGILSRVIASEIQGALRRDAKRSALDWYTQKVREAMAVAAVMYPEIATDEHAKFAFITALAVTSQGEIVPSNVRLTDGVYAYFREHGRFPTDVKAKETAAINGNFVKMNDLLDNLGDAGAREFMSDEFTVKQLTDMGYKVGGENVDTIVRGSAILGPKIGGGFWQNLNGNYAPVTMDLWFMRAWGRLTGTLIGKVDISKQRARFEKALAAEGEKVPRGINGLSKRADALVAEHERNFSKYRSEYDDGTRIKSELTQAATRLQAGISGINQVPLSGGQRKWMRDVIAMARTLLAESGATMTPADLQAVWWYPEKELYGKLGGKGRASDEINVDYAGALKELALTKPGIDAAAVERAVGAVDDGPGRAGTDDAGRVEGGGEEGGGVHEGTGGGQGSLEQKARGQITFGPDQATITLFAGRDLSTLLHEAGHLWMAELEQDAARPDAPDQIKADWQAVAKFVGATDGRVGLSDYEFRQLAPLKAKVDAGGLKSLDPAEREVWDGLQVRVEQNEKLARAMEAYLREGKAPSNELAAAFRSFKNWLVQLYRQLTALGVEITPEIREVFDRLLATDEQIATARTAQGLNPIFTDAKSMGASQAVFNAYTEQANKVADEAEAKLLAAKTAEIRKLRTKEWRADEKLVQAEVRDEVMSESGQQALSLLTRGDFPVGETPEVLRGAKLSRETIVELYGDEGILALLPAGIYRDAPVGPGIFAPDEIAPLLGVDSGRDLIERLMQLEARRKAMAEKGDRRPVAAARIAEETAQRMADRYGDPLNDGTIEQEAQAAIHSDRQALLMSSEMAVLARQAGHTGTIAWADIKNWAAEAVGAKTVRDGTRSGQYLRAERQAWKRVEAALAKGDFEAALKARQDQLVNLALYRESVEAADDVESAVKLFNRYAGAATLKGMDQDYLEQIHGLLEDFEFRTRPDKLLAERKSFETWAAEQAAAGIEVVPPPRLAKGLGLTNYRDMTIEQIRGLHDTVKQIAHLGRTKRTLELDGRKRELDAVLTEMETTAAKGVQRGTSLSVRGKSDVEISVGAARHWLRVVNAELLKIERLLAFADGDKSGRGIFSRMIFRPIAKAEEDTADRRTELAKAQAAIYEKVPAAQRKAWTRRHDLPELGTRLSKEEIIAVALNMGNPQNLAKMLEGEKWTEDGVRAVVNRHLSREEWRFVQDIWTLIDSQWPEFAAMTRDTQGVAPPKVEAVPFLTPFGTTAGGYYPIAYDRRENLKAAKVGERRDEALAVGMAPGAHYGRPSTKAGSAHARTGFSAPLELSLSVIGKHLDEVSHDIFHRRAVMDIFKIINHDRFREALRQRLGVEYEAKFLPWLQRVASEAKVNNATLVGMDKAARALRVNVTTMAMGIRVSTVVQQVAGYASSIASIGSKYMLKGMAEWVRHPFDTAKRVRQSSGAMRNRANNLERDLRAAADKYRGKSTWKASVSRFAFRGIAMADAAVSIPTWVGAYHKGMAEGMSEEDAIAYGDKVVRDTQGGGGAKDLSQFQGAGSETWKLMSMFYSFLNVFYNAQQQLIEDVRTPGKGFAQWADLFWQGMLWMVISPIAAALLAGQAPGDDEDPFYWAMRRIGFGAFAGIPVIRDLAGTIERIQGGQPTGGFKLSPVEGPLEGSTRLINDLVKTFNGEDVSKSFIKNAFNVTGAFTGLPTGQPGVTAQFLYDVLIEGSENPANIQEWLRGLTFGPAK